MDKYKALFSETKNIIILFEQDGSVCEINTEGYKSLGYEQGEKINIHDIFRTCINVNEEGVTLTENEYGKIFDTVAYRKNETCFSVAANFFRFDDDTDCYGACVLNNIVKEKETIRELMSAQVEAEEAHKERNEFVANVTHELRTPVNGVMGLAQNLMDTNLDPEQRESVEIIDQCCKNMIKIINNILDFSKLQAGKFTIENREFSFHQLMDKMVKVNRPQVEAKGLKLLCSVASDIPDMIIGDELRLTQVLNNLLSNAIKFTSVGQIAINVTKTMEIDDTIELFFMVIDTGIGIADNERDKLFKSFSQVDASITRKFGGTGLGLSIVKSLVNMMGGEINVESQKGKGSTFSFSVRMKRAGERKDTGALDEKEASYSFNLGEVSEESEDEEENQLYKLGSEENIKAINENMEKLVLCIEMENWEKANSFADVVKQLVAEDAMNLKRKAFRLQMTVRKGDHDNAIAEYNELKAAIEGTVMQSDGR